jgi:hypothetical protein
MLKMTHSAVTTSSSPCPPAYRAWKRCLEEFPVNCVEDEGQHGPRCLTNGDARPPLFQGSFVGHRKWFRGCIRTREVRAAVHARRAFIRPA